MTSCRQVLIQDPYHEYGGLFIEYLHGLGYEVVCLYSNRRERILHESDCPNPRSPAIAACYEVDVDVEVGRLPALIRHLRLHHNIVGVIPFNETSLLPASYLVSQLGLNWVPPAVLRLFRDKFALKEHLRNTARGVRMNASRRVADAAETLAARRQPDYRRFVLKPNDGYGNRDIGVFDQHSSAAEIEAYFAKARGQSIVMEEYIEGVEYFINGQVDARGDIHTIAIFQYVRGAANGRHNLDMETIRVNHGTPLFDLLQRYGEQVIRATGLIRCPFHLECKVDSAGPCLIEVAARLAGHGNGLLSGALHGTQLDCVAWAAHYYLGTDLYDGARLDWAAYNAHAIRYVHGIAGRRERVYDLQGIDEVEALPAFHRWVKKPELGMRVEPTTDTLSSPWIVILKTESDASAQTAARQVRRLIRWNRRSGPLARLALDLQIRVPRGITRLRQYLKAANHDLPPGPASG